jgi:hypothetical protein
MSEIYDTLTGFYGENRQWRSAKSIADIKNSKKNPSGWAHKAVRNFEQRIGMGTKFKFETDTEEES